MDAKQEAQRLLDLLRRVIYVSELSHREIEHRAGFSRGYLSQLLHGNVELKFRHVITLLDALEMDPGELFAEMYPRRRVFELYDILARPDPALVEQPLIFQLSQLFGFGIETLVDLYERLERCEEALLELGDRGLLDLSKFWRKI